MTKEQLNVLHQFDTHELTTYLRNERHTAFILWQTDDLIGTAEEMGFEMSQEDAEMFIGGIDRASDCEYGITWESVRHCVNDWIRDNTFEVVIEDVSNPEEELTVKFCSLTTNEFIEDYWNDDSIYFYGLSKDEVRSFIGKGEMIGETKIIKVL